MNGTSQHRVQAVIFDMDGVLVDSEPLYVAVNQEMFTHFGIALSREEHQKFVGIPSTAMWRALREQFTLSPSVDDLVQRETEGFVQKIEQLPRLDPIAGIVPLLDRLHHAGVRLAIASSSIRRIVDLMTAKAGIQTYFDAIVSGDAVTRGKPDPEIFLTAAERLHTAPERSLVIEDSPHGVAAANRAGMRCVGFLNPNSGNQDLSRADLLIHDFSAETIAQIMTMLNAEK